MSRNIQSGISSFLRLSQTNCLKVNVFYWFDFFDFSCFKLKTTLKKPFVNRKQDSFSFEKDNSRIFRKSQKIESILIFF